MASWHVKAQSRVRYVRCPVHGFLCIAWMTGHIFYPCEGCTADARDAARRLTLRAV